MEAQSLARAEKNDIPSVTLDNILAPIGSDLELLEEAILRDIRTDVDLLNTVSEHILLSGGKRLRPSLVLLAASVFSGTNTEIRKAAQVVEYLHTATLLHDDVVDGAETRRARKAARQIWGNEASVLTGDYLLSKAFHMLTGLGNLPILVLMSHTTTLMAEGEILQLTRDLGSADEDEYRKIIYHKTACLFGAATRMGGLLAGATGKETDALQNYGESLGMAFQIVDDALDYDDRQQTGKQVGTDLKERKITLPLLHLLSHASEQDRKFIEELLQKRIISMEQVREVMRLMKVYGSISHTLRRAEEHVGSALEQLDCLPPGEARDSLGQVASYVLTRHF